MSLHTLNLRINGKRHSLRGIPAGMTLLVLLRERMGLTGTHYGCGMGLCGACTVHLNGTAVRSCQTPAGSLEGKAVTTIEGLPGTAREAAPGSGPESKPDIGAEETLHPVQRAFIEHQAPQCGFCMSGQIMTAAALLQSTPHPGREDVERAMAGNLCRCGAYHRIRKAVLTAAAKSVAAQSSGIGRRP